MQTVLVPDYIPSPRQKKFHDSDAFETLYGGAAGGGKTAAISAEAVSYCLKYPGISVYMFRRTILELEGTVLKTIRKQCATYMNAGHLTYNQSKRYFKFANGSTINLAYCEKPGDETRYQSVEYQILYIDELTHFTFDQYEYLTTRVRSDNPTHPLKIKAATNPGGIGHAWVKTRFIEDMEPEHLYEYELEDGTMRTRMFIPAKVDDNPSAEFVKSYKANLMGMTNQDLKAALLEGDWDTYAGQAFKEWKRSKFVDGETKDWHVVAPFTVPEHWVKWFSYDYGYGSWAAGVWLTRDPSTNRVYVYREFYESEMGITLQANTLKNYDRGEGITTRLADPSMWKQKASAETGETLAVMFQKAGVAFQPANNERIAGKQAIHSLLAPQADGLPGLQVFASCINLIRTLPDLPYDKHKVEDIDTDAEDHLYDALRYGVINQRQTPKKRPQNRPTRLKMHV